MKKNETIELRIEDLNNLGYGVAHAGKKTVFVSGAVDGDVAVARIIKDCGSYDIAKTEQIITPSAFRCAPSCSVAASCGGCAYASITYEHECAIKRETVRSAFRREGMTVDVAPVTSDGKTAHYRNKAILPIGYDRKRGFYSGFYAPKTHRIVPVERCMLNDDRFNRMAVRAKVIMNESPARFLCGDDLPVVKSLYFRCAVSGDTELTLILEAERSEAAATLADGLCGSFPEIKTVYTNCNPGDISTVLSPDFKLLRGDGAITDTLCGASLSITPASFYQVNHDMAERLYRKGAELLALADGEPICDLYCGIGSIGLAVFRDHPIFGIETVASAVRCATENAKRNGANAAYVCADAAELIEKHPDLPDAVVVDPPRKGCAPELLHDLAARVKKLLYISCNPATLARDAKLLCSLGYTMSTVYPFDLFPRTGHVETVCLLSSKWERSQNVH